MYKKTVVEWKKNCPKIDNWQWKDYVAVESDLGMAFTFITGSRMMKEIEEIIGAENL